MPLDRITIFCFAASYAVALALELWNLRRPGPVTRALTYAATGAGLFAHTFYLAYHALPTQGQSSTLLLLAWMLAVFYLFGTIHHRKLAWGVFALPVVLGLVLVAWLLSGEEAESVAVLSERVQLWAWLHVSAVVLGAVGVCVGFVASVMYLVQSWKLKHKAPPGEGLRLLSLERLEAMNRRAIDLAFPLLTVGLVIGVILLINTRELTWGDPKVIATGLLWLVFALLLYVRHGLHVRGRRVAVGTIITFGLMLLAFAVEHWPNSAGGGP
jgi:ABC-type transport system involved in cytochrome c biogenesis permease subunit